ncbi:MAG: sodium:proton antiporter [Clostridia bacterium]|nr:sodium:proton antiporter [Clostridia bacterium]
METQNYINVAMARRSAVAALGVALAGYLMTLVMPDYSQAETYGIFSVVPALFMIGYIFVTKRMFEGLMLASILGFMMVNPATLIDNFSSSLQSVLMSEDIAWLFLVCGLMGSIIALVEKAGGALAFGEWVAKKATTRKASLLWTWVLGIVIFLDDYLNALVIGSCMSPLCDRHKVPREVLAYVVDSTAAPVCAILPISTWAVFAGRLLESNGWAPDGQGLIYFIKTIPFNFYAWLALLIVPLFIIGVVPAFGPMKKAEERVAQGGPVAPEGSDKIDIHGGEKNEMSEKPKMINFIVPIASLIFFTAVSGIRMEIGVYCTMAVTFLFYLAQGVITPGEYWECTIKGIKNMLTSMLLMVMAFLFAEVNSQIGFTYYMIHTAEKFMTPELMPLVLFLVLSTTEFITGSNWGMYIIALPIVIPLAISMGINVPLAVGCVLSAGVFGSHICFYSDATIVTSAATGCDNFAHARTQIPYGMLCAAIAAVFFLIAGFVM